MKRRDFLAGLASVPLATGMDRAEAAGHLYWKPYREDHDVALTSPGTAWKNAFRQVRDEYDCSLPMRLPSGLRGVLYRNGPALMRLGETPYRHWLDGDGLVHAFRFDGGRLTHRARLVQTHKLKAERAAGRRLAPGYGTSLPGTAITGPDDLNTANINTLMVGGELLALWEGGPPYALDPATLATTGKKVWSPQTQQLPFSAHPRVDAAGNVWSFGYLPGAGMLVLYQIDASGTLVRQAFVPAPNADLVHDFAITEKYLVFVLMPYQYVPDDSRPSLSFLGHYAWRHGQPAQVLVIDKADFGIVLQADCPPVGLFHLGNAWEAGNTLRFGIVNYAHLPDLIDKAGSVMASSMTAYPQTRWTECEVDLAAKSVRMQAAHADTVEFPRYDLRRTGRESRYVHLLASKRRPEDVIFGFNMVQCLDQKTSQVQAYDYGHGFLLEEHLFVPDPGSEQEHRGWLIGTAYDWVRRRTLVSIFDAAQVAQGPIEQVSLPYALPLGLHGRFHPA